VKVTDRGMTLDEYQMSTAITAVYPGEGTREGILYCALGLTSEAGEVADKIKKAMRDDGWVGPHLETSRAMALKAELGDVLWYLCRLAEEIGFDLSDVASYNLRKLADRVEREALGGSVDDR
jgi:NTP pyrophosphatase (non-canonical NTP hydrolase)